MCFAGTLCGLRKEINQRNWSTTKHAAIWLTNKETLVLITSQTLCVYMFAIGCTEHPVKGVTPCTVRSCTDGRRVRRREQYTTWIKWLSSKFRGHKSWWCPVLIVRGKGGLLSFARKAGTRGESLAKAQCQSHYLTVIYMIKWCLEWANIRSKAIAIVSPPAVLYASPLLLWAGSDYIHSHGDISGF